MSPAGTLCFDIFSPPSGDSDVISQVERLSSNEMNIAPRSLRIAFGASARSATVCMVVSRVGGRNLTLPERRSLSTSPWDLDRLRRRQGTFLDPLLTCPALVVEGDDIFGRPRHVGDDEADARIKLGRMPFDLGDPPARQRPPSCLIREAGMGSAHVIGRAANRAFQ